MAFPLKMLEQECGGPRTLLVNDSSHDFGCKVLKEKRILTDLDDEA